MYGEQVDVYSDDPKLNEFIEVGVKSVQIMHWLDNQHPTAI